MNPRIAQAHAAPMMPFPANTRLSDAEAMRLQAVEARDAALLAGFRRLKARIAAWRERQRTLAALRDLSDRELTDIGLVRGSLHRMIDEPLPRMTATRTAPVAANDQSAARRTA
ncbi:DUF1127 domain-containing protein [Muricoccus radiodurans]|uniref:DUF1127 domain-containing protein n=1 Tax=Muricoccus radiodurans TaxID=2231721 RepID=UPI003CEEBC1A